MLYRPTPCAVVEELPGLGQGGKPVQFLQYGVHEGREAGEVVIVPKAFIANCNGSFILQLAEEGLWPLEDADG